MLIDILLKNLYPCAYADSVFSIDYEALKKCGIKGIIFDIDNTLVHHGDDSTEKIDAFISSLQRSGFKVCFLSDNSEKRVNRFLRNIDAPYVSNAGKPSPSGFIRAAALLNAGVDETVFIGDQVFLDILGANLAGMKSILVRFIRTDDETDFGKRRKAEALVLRAYEKSGCKNRLSVLKDERTASEHMTKRKNFSDMNPLFWKISTMKGIAIRNISDIPEIRHIAKEKSSEKLPNVVSEYKSKLIKTGKGIDPLTQINKAENIRIASSMINGIIIDPGETFSFWRIVGKINEKNGYKAGRVIKQGKLTTGLGGGLCNLANTVNNLILHSPLNITEFHKHSDCLASDIGHRVPLSSGTSVNYNYIDYRFINNTDQRVQLLLWNDGEYSRGELRSEKKFPFNYELSEDDHHFEKQGENYYRVSKIYKDTIDRETGAVMDRELVWDNRSLVLFDSKLIPSEMIR